MLRADVAQALEIALGRDKHAGRAGHWLDDDGGNRRGVVQRDDSLQLVGKIGAMLRLAAREAVLGRQMGCAACGRRRSESVPNILRLVDDAAHRDAAEIDGRDSRARGRSAGWRLPWPFTRW